MLRFNRLQILLRHLNSEIIPSQEKIQSSIIIPLNSHLFPPDLFYFLLRKQIEQELNILHIQVDKCLQNEHIIANVFNTLHVVRPKTILLLQFSDKNISHIYSIFQAHAAKITNPRYKFRYKTQIFPLICNS